MPPTPLTQASALAPAYYADPSWLAFEESHVFRAGWQAAARLADLARPGDYVAAQVAGGSVLLSVTETGALAAFHNICRHRAGPVACGRGNANRLRCRYHGWTYDLSGQLRSAPEMQDAHGFDPAGIALWPVRTAVFQGLVFVTLSNAAPPFEAVTEGIASRIAPNDLAVMRFDRQVTYEVECNWKVYIDNFLEGYHVPYVHPALVGTIDYAKYHTELHDWYSLQHTPVRDADPAYGGGHMYYYFLYPNTMLNIVDGRLQLNRVLPLGPRRCRIEFDYHYTPEAKARAEADQDFTDTVQAEDAAICEAVDRNLRSGVYRPGRLSPRREAGVWHFHQLLARAYAA